MSAENTDYLYQHWTEVALNDITASSVTVTVLKNYDDSPLNDEGFWEIQMFTGKSKSKVHVVRNGGSETKYGR